MARERTQRYNALTKAQRNTLARFGVTVDSEGRVNLQTYQGEEVVVSSGNHRVYILGCVGSDDTLIMAHGPEYCRDTQIVTPAYKPERNKGLATIRSSR